VSADVSIILQAIEGGDAGASAELLPIVYEQLRSLAAKRIASEAPGQTLQATALVHEAYVRLVGNNDVRWDSRGHFFAAAAEAMRRILIDRARAKKREKRGGDQRRRVDLTSADLTIDAVPDEVLDLDEALQKLAAEDPVKADLVKLRFFGGMSMREAAAFLRISTTTADRYWAYARAFLYAEIRESSGLEGS
jgi:RNA polymerase sigma factor (TIGR02999 family)